MRRFANRYSCIVLLLGIGLAVLLASCDLIRNERSSAVPQDLEKVWQTYRALQNRYVDHETLDPDALADAAIRGMLDSLNDPFTSYFTSDRFQSSLADVEGEFEGIGATVTMQGEVPTIVSPIPDTPAAKAGLQPGDQIIGVDGDPIAGLTLQEVIAIIRGPQGAPVDLLIRSSETNATRSVTIVRDTIRVSTVRSQPIDQDVAYLRISRFVSETPNDLADILIELERTENSGIILDLRNNPGGLVTAVVDVASEFLADGLVLYEIDAKGNRTDWKVSKDGRYTEAPIVVLVNGGSASGAEVVAGALQSAGRAPVIGTKTFGKGVVNTAIQLKDGSGIYIPSATWFTPSGKQIGRIGLSPDIEVATTIQDMREGRDPQLVTALETIRAAIAATGNEGSD